MGIIILFAIIFLWCLYMSSWTPPEPELNHLNHPDHPMNAQRQRWRMNSNDGYLEGRYLGLTRAIQLAYKRGENTCQVPFEGIPKEVIDQLRIDGYTIASNGEDRIYTIYTDPDF